MYRGSLIPQFQALQSLLSARFSTAKLAQLTTSLYALNLQKIFSA